MEPLHGIFPLGIGSFPHRDPERAVDLVLEYFPEIPLWPQLPQSRFRENMYVQFTSFLPAVHLDESHRHIHLDSRSAAPAVLEKFYDRALANDLERFRLDETYAAGFYQLLRTLEDKGAPPGMIALKGHVTGPFSFGLGVADEHRKAVIYHDELFEAVTTGLSLNARWQAEQLGRFAHRVIIFVDEPYLVSFGSALINVDRSRVVESLNRVIGQIHQGGGLAGIHCCGNTDWSLVLDTGLDILSFDAHEHFENLLLYEGPLQHFLNRGGMMAWGIIPSGDEVLNQSGEALVSRLASQVMELENRLGIRSASSLRERGFVTPSCGLGSQNETVAENALRKTRYAAGSVQFEWAP